MNVDAVFFNYLQNFSLVYKLVRKSEETNEQPHVYENPAWNPNIQDPF